ncbi:putative lipase [Trypanosoma rangeli]|uniref:Putative lipase n=1 Tax=Trypanosoma rangeli TaxID=5698 RepID=A0A3R7RFL4_TRYRA|nr:putative lipase [Trypanosoma rangeli]RNF01714.1 putative lipase [Trypanosoma rangeli]|eukprot:RNF01714.1 putative lipase [Trypanosoma rangeli]
MVVPRAVCADTCAAYRRLLGAVKQVTRDCPLYRKEGLTRYVALRFFDSAEQNRRRYLQLREEMVSQRGRGRHRKLHAMEAQYESFIARELQRVREVAEQILLAPGNRTLTSMLQVLAAGVGNSYYQHTVEQNYFHYCEFENKRMERNEVEEEATAERQNRIMQHALIPYGERLLFLHRLNVKHDPDSAQEHGSLTSWQVTEAIIGTRSGVSAHHMSHGKEDVVVEVDETYNKQIVYVRCELYDWGREVERVEITESEEVRGTVFHAEYFSVAQRLCDALLAETPLHAYRSTVVVGHGVGGAVGFCLALLLHARGFDVKNCVTLGAPKAVQKTLERYIHAINPIRIVLEGDPLIDLPVTGAEGDAFVHYGEILLMASAATPQQEGDEEGGRQEINLTAASGTLTAEALSDLLDSAQHVPLACEISETERDNEELQVEGGLEEDEEGASEFGRIAAERYAAGFLPEDYIGRLVDITVPLTYAEGDEVWDEGGNAKMWRESALQPHISGSHG